MLLTTKVSRLKVLAFNIVDGDEDTVVAANGDTVIKYDNSFVSTGEPALIFLCRNASSNTVSMAFFYRQTLRTGVQVITSSFC